MSGQYRTDLFGKLKYFALPFFLKRGLLSYILQENESQWKFSVAHGHNIGGQIITKIIKVRFTDTDDKMILPIKNYSFLVGFECESKRLSVMLN